MAPTGKKVGTVRLQNLSYAHKQAAVLMAAVELDLFTQISQGCNRLVDIAEAVGISDVNAERLTVACAALDLIEKQGEIFSNAPDVERFLVSSKPTYIGP